MSNQITPEEAQRITETNWKNRTEGLAAENSCGWCIFSGGEPCEECPVHRILGYCIDIPVVNAFYYSEDGRKTQKLASEIFDLVVQHHDQFIAVGHQILAERREELSDE